MKINVHIVFFVSLLTFVLNVACSSPLIVIGDYVNVFFDSSSSLVWESNIFYDEEIEEEDLRLFISPGFEANIGSKLSGFNALVRADYEMQRFASLSELNGDYLSLATIGSYNGTRLDLDASYSLDEEQTTAGEQGTSGNVLIKIDMMKAHLLGTYLLSPKFSLESGTSYYNREPREDRLADIESFSIPFDVFYKLTSKLDVSIGYQYTFQEVKTEFENYNRKLHFLNVGARGDLLSKLNGSFRIGLRSLNPQGATRESDSNLGLTADFTYLGTPKLKSRLILRRDFEVGGEGQSAESTSAKLDLNYVIFTNYSASAYTNLIYRKYKDGNSGEDFINRTGFRFFYLPNQYWRFSIGYAYIENDSNRIQQGYVNNVLDILASLRY